MVFLPSASDFNPDSGADGWETGKDSGLQVIVLNLTVSIACLSNDRHHSSQALGMQRHLGHTPPSTVSL